MSQLDIAKRDAEAKHIVATLVEELCDVLNTIGTSGAAVDGIADGLQSQHRTLQQSAVGVLINGLRQYGHNAVRTKYYDARNEAAVKHCNGLDPTNFPYI